MSIVLETLIRHFEREPNAVMWPNGIALRHGEIAAVLRHHALPVADRIRELEGDAKKWRSRATDKHLRIGTLNARIRELEAQLTLPPIREKFVRVSDELVAELKAAPSKPVTVAIVEDGNELHMTFTEAQQAASEPVAWVLYDYDLTEVVNLTAIADVAQRWRLGYGYTRVVPLYAHPSAAAVSVTEAMVDAALDAYAVAIGHATEHREAVRFAITEALTRPTTPTRGSDE